MADCIDNQSLESFIKEHFIKPPSLSEVHSAIEAVLLNVPLEGENIKTDIKE